MDQRMMMPTSVIRFLDNKSILVTGATGFVAKVFTEKILRVQPKVKKLYLLLRAQDSESAMHRFNTKVIAKDLFKVVKKKHGINLDSFIDEKITVIAGDVTHENLGVEDSDLLEELLEEVDVVTNLAASTSFDERYDVAFGINTLGPLQVFNFARNCKRLRVLLHVSTAYVCGEQEGVIPEEPYKLGQSLNGTSGLDIYAERNLIDERLKELDSHNGVSPNYISSIMKDLGTTRAKKYGWPNTYVFTKAMGEMLLAYALRDNNAIPLVTIRPTVVIGTYKEPFPGWIEGPKTVDALIVGYGKGRLTFFPGPRQMILDMIPVDMVVNAMLVAMVAHADQPNHSIYHVGSSKSNPVIWSSVQDYLLRYFTEQPWINKQGEPVIVRKPTQLTTLLFLRIYMQLRYLILLQVLNILNKATKNYFQKTNVTLSREVKFLMRLNELYEPYFFFKGVLDDTNTENLRKAAREKGLETEIFYFDPKAINWDEYFTYTHIAGVVKYCFRG